jgi:hypothetical protein
MIIAKAESTSKFKPVPTGMHLARCYRIIDLGTQKKVWQGKESFKRQIMMQFEIHGEDDEDNPIVTDKGDPMSISKNYTLSLHENARLRIDLESWRGAAFTAEEIKGFDLTRVLGAWAMVNVAKSLGDDGKEYTNINNINSVPSSIKKSGLPEAFNEAKMFSLDKPDLVLFESFGDKLKDKIKSSPEWQSKAETKSFDAATAFDELESSDTDDIPFN